MEGGVRTTVVCGVRPGGGLDAGVGGEVGVGCEQIWVHQEVGSGEAWYEERGGRIKVTA